MATTYEKLKKEYEGLVGKIQSISTTYAGALSSRASLQGQTFEAAAQAGKDAAKLRAGGHQGKKLADFKSEKSIASLLKYGADNQKAAKKQLDKVLKIIPEFRKLDTRMAAMKKELGEEIKNRDKKANRKILKIKSNSLPDLKKLFQTMEKDEDKFIDELRENLNDAKTDFSEQFFDRFEILFDDELKKTKMERDEAEQWDKAGVLAANLRTQIMYRKQARKLQAEAKKLCSQALLAAKDGKSPKALLDGAAKRYKAMRKITETQTKARQQLVKSFSEAKKRKNAQGQKSAKEGIAMIDSTIAIDAEMKALLQKVTSETFKLQTAS